MKALRKPKTILLIVLSLLLLGAVLVARAAPSVVRCYLVKWSALDNIAPNVYVDPDMPESQGQTLLSSLADARERVAALYGECEAKPTIIAGHTMEVMKTYGGNSYNRAGRAYLTSVAAFSVLGPNGTRNLDILAHALGHAELDARIGHANKSRVPNWFDEGLAVQFDDRYSEAEWRARTDDGRTAPDVDEMDIITHDDWLGYATAGHEVRRWLDIVGQTGFFTLLEALKEGAEFQEMYRSIERAHASTAPEPTPTVAPTAEATAAPQPPTTVSQTVEATIPPQPVCAPTSGDYWPTEAWRTFAPGDQGMDAAALEQLVEIAGENVAYVIARNGYVVAEHYPPDFPESYSHHIHSCTKSVTSILIGIALQQGIVGGVDDNILDYFPEYEFELVDERKRAITLHHILSMSSGLDWRGGIGGSDVDGMLPTLDWVQYTLDRPMAREPGSEFNYNSGGTHLLSAIIQRALEMTTESYAREELFGPLGISELRWDYYVSPKGVTPGAWGLFLSARDMAKIGHLYLNQGCWEGEQIVSPDWVRESTRAHIAGPNSNVDYGYQWWLPKQYARDVYQARGWYGDHYAFITVVPDLDLVLVFAGERPGDDAVEYIIQAAIP